MRDHISFFNKKYIAVIIMSFVTAVALLTVCTKSSFLYPLNDWVDANCFFTVGKSMGNGLVVYRDIYEQKGVLLYAIHMLAYFISNDTFIGVFVFEIINAAVFMFFAYKILFLYNCRKSSLIIIPIFAALVYSSQAFCQGDSAEEFCLPFLMCGIYLSIKAIKTNVFFSPKELFTLGIICGCILWIKYTMLGFFIGFIIVPFFWIVKDKLWKDLAKSICFGLLGIAVVSIPVFIYFGINGALDELFKVYFYDNIFLYSEGNKNASFIEKFIGIITITVQSVYKAFKENIWLFIMMFSGVMYGFLKDGKKQLLNYIIIIIFTSLFIYGGGRHYDYYSLPLAVFAIYGFIFIAEAAEIILQKRGGAVLKMSVVFTLVFSIFLSWLLCENTSSMFVSKDELPQYKFKQIICCSFSQKIKKLFA